jgi:hypothetical protein
MEVDGQNCFGSDQLNQLLFLAEGVPNVVTDVVLIG